MLKTHFIRFKLFIPQLKFIIINPSTVEVLVLVSISLNVLLQESLLAPQSGALRIRAYGDFQYQPNPSIHPLIAFEHLSLSMII